MMFDQQILATLQQATTAAVAASSVSTMPIKYVGLTFSVPSDQRYLECVFIPNNIIDAYWDNSRVYRGTFRLLQHWNIDGAGVYPAMIALQSVASYFTKDRAFANGVRVVNAPDMSGIIENGPEIIVPASIQYRCFQQS